MERARLFVRYAVGVLTSRRSILGEQLVLHARATTRRKVALDSARSDGAPPTNRRRAGKASDPGFRFWPQPANLSRAE
jgi:hypothetical protein